MHQLESPTTFGYINKTSDAYKIIYNQWRNFFMTKGSHGSPMVFNFNFFIYLYVFFKILICIYIIFIKLYIYIYYLYI